jgi:hypothetical protein
LISLKEFFKDNIGKTQECPEYHKQIQEGITRTTEVRIELCRQFFIRVWDRLDNIIEGLSEKNFHNVPTANPYPIRDVKFLAEDVQELSEFLAKTIDY